MSVVYLPSFADHGAALSYSDVGESTHHACSLHTHSLSPSRSLAHSRPLLGPSSTMIESTTAYGSFDIIHCIITLFAYFSFVNPRQRLQQWHHRPWRSLHRWQRQPEWPRRRRQWHPAGQTLAAALAAKHVFFFQYGWLLQPRSPLESSFCVYARVLHVRMLAFCMFYAVGLSLACFTYVRTRPPEGIRINPGPLLGNDALGIKTLQGLSPGILKFTVYRPQPGLLGPGAGGGGLLPGSGPAPRGRFCRRG